MLARLYQNKAKEKAFIDPNPPGRAHVAALARLGNSFWMGINNRKTHPDARKILKDGFVSSCIHAEMDAIVKIPRDVRHKIKLFVMRFQKNGKLTMAKPCPTCHTFILSQGIDMKNVYYTDWDGEWQCLNE